MDFKDFKYKGHRNSFTALNEIYFWTIPILAQAILQTMKHLHLRKYAERASVLAYLCLAESSN
jgi:hypothetical protein